MRQHGSYRLYADADLDSDYAFERYDEDVTPQIAMFSEDAILVALRRAGRMMLLVGNTGQQTSTISLKLARLLVADERYGVRICNSERDDWEKASRRSGSQLISLALTIEGRGYWLVELTRIDSKTAVLAQAEPGDLR